MASEPVLQKLVYKVNHCGKEQQLSKEPQRAPEEGYNHHGGKQKEDVLIPSLQSHTYQSRFWLINVSHVRTLLCGMPTGTKSVYICRQRGVGGESMDRLELVIRNTEEIVTLDELKALLETREHPRCYVGYETSGKVHLGHMLTANKLIDMQQAGFDVVVLLADLHAYLNEKGSLEEVREIADYNRDCFMALGLDPEKTEFIYGTDYQLQAEYVIKVLQMARNTTLNRARRSMDEVSRNAENPMVSQMIYPLMQAVDIADLKVDVAVGGIDQRKIHMLAREELPRLGLPAPICLHTPLIPGLDGQKMSSSKGNNIAVDEAAEDVEKKIMSAFCPARVVENNPVMAIMKYHIFPRLGEVMVKRPDKFGGDVSFDSYQAVEEAFVSGALHPMDLKKSAAQSMIHILEPVREKMGQD